MYRPDLSSATFAYYADSYEYRKYIWSLSTFDEEAYKNSFKPEFEVFYIGWLEAGHSFTKGEVSPPFVAALQRLCENPAHRYKGSHTCDFCGGHPIVKSKGKDMLLGCAEIEVKGDNGIYLAPALTLHYVTEHGYLPPQEFIDAVLATEK